MRVPYLHDEDVDMLRLWCPPLQPCAAPDQWGMPLPGFPDLESRRMNEPCKTCLPAVPRHTMQRVLLRDGRRIQICERCGSEVAVLDNAADVEKASTLLTILKDLVREANRRNGVEGHDDELEFADAFAKLRALGFLDLPVAQFSERVAAAIASMNRGPDYCPFKRRPPPPIPRIRRAGRWLQPNADPS